jgi:serine/threonine-protein kinase
MSEPWQPDESTVHQQSPSDPLDAGLAVAFGSDTPPTPAVSAAAPVHLRDMDGAGQAPPPPGAALGRYQLLGEVGQGGMGTVLRVRDPELGRDLAVKLLRPERQDDPEALRRFVEEAQIGGQLQHPGTVPVHELGRLSDGRPFFTMKLVKGRTLADLLAERASPQQDLPRFLGIFEQVCQPVAYAHARGVIHRDLKPQNIMVGAFGEVQVMDWGLAKVLPAHRERPARRERERPEDAPVAHAPGSPPSTICTVRTAAADAASQAGTVVGTPAYMAPEQALGAVEQLDERSDVFGLGAILCEILTGRPPYVAEAGWKLHQQAMLAELNDAFTRLDTSGADAELLALARRCLAREPAERPSDAGAVAQAVAAYRAAVAERLRRSELERTAAQAKAREERRRRQLTAALAGAVLLLAAAGGGGAWLVQQRQAHRQEVAREVRSAARQAQERGEAAWQANDLDRLAEARAEAEKAVQVARSGEAGEEVLAEAQALREQLEARRAQAERNRALLTALLDVRGPHETKTYQRSDRGTMLALAEPTADEQFATAFRRWGLDLDTVPLAEAVARLQQQPAAVVQEVVAGLDEWAQERRQKQRPEASWRRLAELADRLDGNERTRELRRLLADNRLRQERLVGALTQALLPCSALSHPLTGEQQRRLRQWAAQLDPGAEPVLSVLALVRALRVGGDEQTAEQLLRRCLVARPGAEVLWLTLAQLLERQRPPRLAEAIACYQTARALHPELGIGLSKALCAAGKAADAVAILRDLLRRQPDHPELHFHLGYALTAGRRLDDALTAYQRAIALQPELAEAHNNIGVVLCDQGRLDEAFAALQKANALQPDDADVHTNLGVVLADQGRVDDALAAYQKAIALQPDIAKAHYNRGNALRAKGRVEEALAAYQKAIALQPDYAMAYNNLGNVLRGMGRAQEALAAYQRAIALQPDFAKAYNNLGAALVDEGRHEEAIAAYRQAIALQPDYAMAHNNLGNVLRAKGRVEEALAAYRRAIALQPDFAMAYRNLGNALYGKGRREEAVAAYRKAIALQPGDARAHYTLGLYLRGTGRLDEALGAFRQAIALQPDYVEAHLALGNALATTGRLDDAVTAVQRAIALRPEHAESHNTLGLVLALTGRLDDARAAHQRAVALKPDFADAHCRLGFALQRQGEFAASLAAFRRGHELGSKQANWGFPSARWVEDAEQLVQLDTRLPAFLSGEAKPSDAAECAALARLCRFRRLHVAAVGFWDEAFRRNPQLAEDRAKINPRYNAACAAVLAAAGQGQDAPRLDAQERSRLRQRAHDWLRTEVEHLTKERDRNTPETRTAVRQALAAWQHNPELAGVREAAGLAKLPEVERQAWQQLWADAAALLPRAGQK